MKKLVSLMAVLLSLALLAVPLCAGAESIDMISLQASDPVITYNGEALIDLTGLTVQLSGGSTADGSIFQLILDILGGGNTAGSALIQFDPNGLVGYVGGMSQAYGIPMETLESFMADFSSSLNEELGSLTAIDEEWKLPEEIVELVANYIAENAVVGEETAYEAELSTGAATGTSVSISADLNALMSQIVEMLDNDPVMAELLKAANDGESDPVESWSELFNVSEMDWQLTGASINGENFEGGQYNIAASSGYETVNIAFDFLDERVSDTDEAARFSLTMTPTSEEFNGQSVYLTADATASGDDFTMSAHAGYDFGDDGAADVSLMCAMADGNFTATLSDSAETFSANCAATDGSFTASLAEDGAELLSIYADWSGEVFSAGMSGDEFGNLDITLTPEADDNYIFKGGLAINYTDAMGDNYAVSCTLGAKPGSVDTADTYISPDVVVDITGMDDEQMSGCEEELTIAMQNILMSLAQYVPGLQAMFE